MNFLVLFSATADLYLTTSCYLAQNWFYEVFENDKLIREIDVL